MSSEFVRLTHPESVYTEKNLLHSELELLNSTRHLLNYKALRFEENKIKIALKTKLKETQDIMKFLDKSLPTVKMEDSKPQEVEQELEVTQEEIDSSRLETELNRIKAKLANLSS